MASDIDRKELPLTRRAIERASAQERLLYGGLVKQLRKDRGLTQGQLQERSGVTSRTIRNIELEEKAGQADNLIRLFTALDIDLDGTLWGVDVQKYTAMLAPLIRDIAPDHRLGAVSEVIPVLSRAIAAHPNVAASEMSIDDVLRAVEDARERGEKGDYDVAATTREDRTLGEFHDDGDARDGL